MSAAAISRELRTAESSAGARLADLKDCGLVAARRDGNETFFTYAPQDAWVAQAVGMLEKAYAERRYKVMELIFSKPIENLRVFAGAFRFRKDE